MAPTDMDADAVVRMVDMLACAVREAVADQIAQEKFSYTLDEVAALTGLSKRSMLEDCRAKPPRLAHVKKGRAYAMTREQIIAMLAAHTRGPQTTVDDDAAEAEAERVFQRLLRKQARAVA